MKIIAIIQARMGSHRLPGKMLMELAGKKIVDHVLDRVNKSHYINEVVVATSISENNLPLVAHVATRRTRVFVGNEDDVLDRFYQVAKLLEPDVIVRITGDCPMIDPSLIDLTIKTYFESKTDYCFNCGGNKIYPDGMDVEVFSFHALEKAYHEATKKSDREHVTPYIRQSGKFAVSFLEAPEDYSKIRITIDEERDLIALKQIYQKLENVTDFSLNDVIEILNNNPEIAAINNSIVRNAGYLKSLAEEQNGGI